MGEANELPVSGTTAAAALPNDAELRAAIMARSSGVKIEEPAKPIEATGNTDPAPTEEAKPAEPEEKAPDEADSATQEEKKPPKTPEQREIDRLRKSTARLTRQREEARALLELTRQQLPVKTEPATNDNETLSLTRAELAELVKQQAEKIAPTIQSQKAEIEHRKSVVDTLAKSWGQEKFDSLASDLDDAFGGLVDSSGKPKAATDAIFESDNPKALIEYLADPDNMDEAESIAQMNPIQAGRAIAKLEVKLEAASKQAKPKPSNAPKPLESVKGAGISKGMPDPTDTKAYIAWRMAKDRAEAR